MEYVRFAIFLACIIFSFLCWRKQFRLLTTITPRYLNCWSSPPPPPFSSERAAPPPVGPHAPLQISSSPHPVLHTQWQNVPASTLQLLKSDIPQLHPQSLASIRPSECLFYTGITAPLHTYYYIFHHPQYQSYAYTTVMYFYSPPPSSIYLPLTHSPLHPPPQHSSPSPAVCSFIGTASFALQYAARQTTQPQQFIFIFSHHCAIWI